MIWPQSCPTVKELSTSQLVFSAFLHSPSVYLAFEDVACEHNSGGKYDIWMYEYNSGCEQKS